MDNKTNEIKKLKNRVKILSAGINSNFKIIAESLLLHTTEDFNSFIKKNKLTSQLSSVKKILEKYDLALKKKDKITQLTKKIDSLEKEIKDTFKKLDDVKKENSKYFVGIAETIFNIFKNDQTNVKRFEPYFTDIIDLNKHNLEIDKKLKDIDSSNENSSFIKKMANTGEKAILVTRKKVNSVKFISFLKRAGEKMCIDKIYEAEINRDISGFFEPYKNNSEIEIELNLKIERLDAEKSNIKTMEQEIMQEFNDDPSKYLKNMLAEKEKLLQEFGEKICSIVVLTKNENNAEDMDLKVTNEESAVIENIKDSIKEKNEIEDRINIIEKEIEIDKIEKNIETKKNTIDSKEIKIAELQKEVESIKENIAVLKEEAAGLKKEIIK
jgi:hypothetical protein